MNVGQLKLLLQDMPDDTLVVVSGSDHSYMSASASISEAELHGSLRHPEHICMFYGPENACDPPGELITVLWVG